MEQIKIILKECWGGLGLNTASSSSRSLTLAFKAFLSCSISRSSGRENLGLWGSFSSNTIFPLRPEFIWDIWFHEFFFWVSFLNFNQIKNIPSLLDNAPNYLVRCVIQKRLTWMLTKFFTFLSCFTQLLLQMMEIPLLIMSLLKKIVFG